VCLRLQLRFVLVSDGFWFSSGPGIGNADPKIMAVGTEPRHFLSFVTLRQTILIGSRLSCNAMNTENAS